MIHGLDFHHSASFYPYGVSAFAQFSHRIRGGQPYHVRESTVGLLHLALFYAVGFFVIADAVSLRALAVADAEFVLRIHLVGDFGAHGVGETYRFHGSAVGLVRRVEYFLRDVCEYGDGKALLAG